MNTNPGCSPADQLGVATLAEPEKQKPQRGGICWQTGPAEYHMNAIERVGNSTIEGWREICYLAGIIWQVFSISARARYWSRTVRAEFYRQIISTGIDASGFVIYVAFAVGISVVAQILVWLELIGQSRSLGPLLVTVLVREAAPVLINLLAIGRNGTALTSELSNMKISGEVRVLDAQGLDPFIYLVMPRVLSLTLSVFCLAVLFVVVAFASGYLSKLVLSHSAVDPGTFVRSIIFSVSPVDLINFLSKTIIPALFTGAICCSQGLRVQTSLTEVPKANKRAVALSVRALFAIAALVSLLTYM